MPNFEDDSGNCHAPDPNGLACYKSRIGCPIHPRQKRKCHECSELSALRLDNERLREVIRTIRARCVELDDSDAVSETLDITSAALERGGKTAKKAAPSDLMFDQMLKDYRTVVKKTRKALGVKS